MGDALHRADESFTAKVVGIIDLTLEQLQESSLVLATPSREDSFLSGFGVDGTVLKMLDRDKGAVIGEIRELKSAKKWSEIIDIFHPVEEKYPELAALNLCDDINQEIAFALGAVNRHDEALECLKVIVESQPNNGLAHYSIGYNVLDKMYNARTNRLSIPFQQKKLLLELGHNHFAKAIDLRPESVTFSYRHGMLYKDIENKPQKAIPLFRNAISNWEKLSTREQQDQHQQKPKYIRSLYHLASCLLKQNKPQESLCFLEKMLAQDQEKNHMDSLYKHFALGKVYYALGNWQECLKSLDLAMSTAERGQNIDYVNELMARNYLQTGMALEGITLLEKIPARRRRPYIQWTYADLLASLGEIERAIKLLHQVASCDRRSKHKALIRICRLELRRDQVEKGFEAVEQANTFCLQTYTNPSKEGLFWQAVCLYRLRRFSECEEITSELQLRKYHNPDLNRLVKLLVEKKLERSRKPVLHLAG